MTRDEAIAIIRKEYLCVDRDCGVEKNCGKCDLVMPSKKPILEAYKMAIKALEQETCEDCISREAVDTLVDELAGAISDERCHIPRGRSTAAIMQDILDLPSAKPQPEEDCCTCKHRYYETWQCVRCRVRFPSHYERRDEHHGSQGVMLLQSLEPAMTELTTALMINLIRHILPVGCGTRAISRPGCRCHRTRRKARIRDEQGNHCQAV